MSEDQAPSADANTPKKKGLGGTAMRFASALPLIPLVIWLLFWAPKIGFQIFGFVWIAICADEMMRMALPGSVLGRLWGVAASLGLTAVAFYWPVPGALTVIALGLTLGALIVGLLEPEPIEAAATRIGWLFAGPIYVAGTLSCLARIHGFDHGGAWVFFAMVAAFLSDTGAYFAGRAFGKHKLYPKLSPKKTVEGSIGGLVAVGVGAVVIQKLMLPTLPLVDVIVLGVVAAALGQAGDLLESLLKRSTGVKDSGNIMPGHGGLLDRSDALMFTGATVWVYLTYLLPLRS
ncbi:MAG: phosphatidate cytidylyltransferase [Myxococcota bacterium]